MKTISIMITSYNLEDYIDKAINSVVSQEYPCNWELLIGDDGSTDSTVEHINKWIEKFPSNIVLYKWSKENVHSMNGFRAAANRANLLERANGNYLIFLDGDDCWIGTDKIKRQYDLLEKPEYADCSCCGHNIIKYNVDTKSGYSMVSDRYKQRTFDKNQYYRHGMYIHTNTILFRSECKSLMLDSIYRGFLNDVFITFCMLQFGKMLYLPDSYAQYNITGTGLWTGGNKVYGRFRNVHLYDLEVRIDPSLQPLVFDALCPNMEVILNEYTNADVPKIKPLVEGLDKDIFKYTTILYNIENPTPEELAFKKSLRKQIFLQKIKHRINMIRIILYK